MEKGLSGLAMVGGMITVALISSAAGQIYSGWSNYRDYTMNPSVTGITTNQVNFPVLVRLTSANAAVFGNATSPADLRFAKGANLNVGYPYQVERWDATDQLAEVWVLVDTVFAASTSQGIRMYWGNASAPAASSGPAVFNTANGFTGVWHLNSAVGTGPFTFPDATANGFNGSSFGTTDTAAVIADGRKFNAAGNGDSIVIPGLLGEPATVTLSAWVKVDSIIYENTGSEIISIGDCAAIRASRNTTGTRDSLYVFYHIASGSWNITYSAGGPNVLLKAGWKHVVFVCNPSDLSQQVYIDGLLQGGSSSYNNAIYYSGAGSNTKLGAYAGNAISSATHNFGGVMCEVRVENVARSADWINLSFQNQQANQTFVTLVPGPNSPVLSSPANGAINQPLAVTLAWGAVATATSYAVQVSTSPAFGTTAFGQSGTAATSFAVSGLANSATYYWRANCTSAIGTSAWSSVWSFSTPYPTPGASSLVAPVNNAVNQPYTVNLSWTAATNATSYAVQVSTTATFLTVFFQQSGLSGTSLPLSGFGALTEYYWRVIAANPSANGSWTGAWSFTTASLPAAPALSSPSNGATNQPAPISLSWNTVSGAAGYVLQVASVSDFSIVTQIGGVTATSQSVGGLASNTLFYWKVCAVNPWGNGAWSSVWSFTTGYIPTIPVLSSPSSGSTGEPLALTLLWNPVSNAATYSMQVSTSASFATLFSSQSGLASNSASLSGLAYNVTYYWRANAANAFGTSAWSSAWSFTTVNAVPSAPNLSLPVNNALAQLTVLTLGWTAGSGGGAPASYTVQVSTARNFTSYSVNQGGVAATSLQVTGLAVAATYYWQVSGVNSVGTGAWSTVWSFTTINGAPGAPSLTSPVNGAKLASTSAPLSWTAVAGAASYAVQISTIANFISFNQDTVTVPSCTFTGLSYATHFWRANATNGLGTSAWSGVWSFTTAATSVLSFSTTPLETSCFINGGNLSYTMAQPGAVRISFCDILGREKTVINRLQSSGHYALSLKCLNLSAGVYLVHFKAGNMEKRMKVMVSGR